MAEETTRFSVNTSRMDPYRTFKFRIRFDDQPKVYVAGISKVSALKRSTEVVSWREAGDASHERKLVGQTKWDPITLEAGLTHDPTFERWANLVHTVRGDGDVSLKSFRRDVYIDVFDLQGNKVFTYVVLRCWVSEYQALPDLDASANAVGIRTLKLENEGWYRDEAVTEVAER